MTFYFSRVTGNYGTNTAAVDVMFYNLKNFLVTYAGWTVMQSTDGISAPTLTDQLTSSGTGSGGAGNNSGWWVVRAPSYAGNTREMCFFKNNTASCSQYRGVSYSVQGFSRTIGQGSTDGSHIAVATTVAPIAYDSVWGQYTFNTPATSIAASTTFSVSGIYGYNFIASVASIQAQEPWNYLMCADSSTGGWFLFVYTQSNLLPMSLIGYDPLTDADPNDGDPAAFIFALANTGSQAPLGSSFVYNQIQSSNTYQFAKGWFNKRAYTSITDATNAGNTDFASMVSLMGMYYYYKAYNASGSTNLPYDGQGTNNYVSSIYPSLNDKKIPLLPFYYMMKEPTWGTNVVKGKSTFFKINPVSRFATSALSTGSSSQNYLSISGDTGFTSSALVIPWDGSAPLET